MTEIPRIPSSGRPEERIPLDKDVKGFMDGQEMAVAVIVAYLIKRFLPALTRRFGKSPIAHRIEDVLQDGLVNIHLNKKQFNPARGRFDVWAYRIVLNCAYDEIKRIKHEASTVDFDLGLLADDLVSIEGGGRFAVPLRFLFRRNGPEAAPCPPQDYDGAPRGRAEDAPFLRQLP